MKFAGVILVIASSSVYGIFQASLLKKRELICDDIIRLCDMLLIDMETVRTPFTVLLDKLLSGASFKYIDFINDDLIYGKGNVNTCLSKEDNILIKEFFCSFGRYDVQSQLKHIVLFKSKMEISKNEYVKIYNSKARVYAAFGVCFGVIISLALI